MIKNLVFSIILVSTAALAADTITGTVHNLTTSQPAVGDEVVLLQLGQGMQEESRAKTDAQGKFTLNVTSPKDQHLIQVSHQGVNYDQAVNGAGPVDIGVYDAVANIPGLSGKIGVAQLESDGKVLKITEMYEIDNTSNPPVTQARPDNFQITVPQKAAFDLVQARRGQSMWLNVTPDPVKGQSGKYRINFPIRPGPTQLNITYHIPYNGSATLHLRVPYPIERFGVLHPTSMTFKSLQPNAFRSAVMPHDLTGEVALAITPDQVPAFSISGTGRAALHGTEGAAVPQPAAPAPAPPVVAAAPPPSARPQSSAPPSPANQSRKELLLMIAGIIVILAVGGLTLWRMNRRKPALVTANAGSTSGKPLLDALKEELFQLESDRLHGTISAEEYATTKEALNKSIERATARESAG